MEYERAMLQLSFSALQRAENSSIALSCRARSRDVSFQCSSASRKFLNPELLYDYARYRSCFSALQRAENSSMLAALAALVLPRCFSALQRAENSSILECLAGVPVAELFQCSSASRKFLN